MLLLPLPLAALCLPPIFVAAAIVAAAQWALFGRFTTKMKVKSTRAFLMRIYMFQPGAAIKIATAF